MTVRVRFLLSERHNPYSRRRANGQRWWGYPSRNGGATPRVIVLHTAEADPTSRSALAVADWQAHRATVPSSYHCITDSHNIVTTATDDQVAFHVRGYNTHSLGLSVATRASRWGRNPRWDEHAIANAAQRAAEWSQAYNIPLRWLTKEQADQGMSGFARHSTLDPGRRSDPGDNFPARMFFNDILDILSPEDDVPLTPEQEQALAAIPDLDAKVDWIMRALGNRYEPTKNIIDGKPTQLSVGHDVKTIREQTE